MSMHYTFAGKRVLITGGGQGVGRQLVQRFHDDYAIVFTVDKNVESIKNIRRELPKVTAEIVDLSDWEETKKVIESFGPIDHLVNNAAIVIPQPFMSLTKETFDKQFSVNVAAMINVTQVVGKTMIAREYSGTIVNISSIGSKLAGVNNCALYCASKAAVNSLTKSMAIDLGTHNIRVNSICPGMINSPMLSNNVRPSGDSDIDPELMISGYMARLAIKRLIEPNEIADLVMFLLSPMSSMITGESIIIDGGFLTN